MQAEDAGDLPAAQALAERALRLDRYTDSRYVRLAELLTLQNRVAAAIAVLDDAAEVAREHGRRHPGRDEAPSRRTAPSDGYRGVRSAPAGVPASEDARALGQRGRGVWARTAMAAIGTTRTASDRDAGMSVSS